MPRKKQSKIANAAAFRRDDGNPNIVLEFPSRCLIDTNVFLGASRTDYNENQRECASKCLAIMEAVASETITRVVLDLGKDHSEIWDEYCHKLKPFGGNGYGEAILKTLFNTGRFDYVKITPIGANQYAEFPNHVKLADFDASDKKFIATANACPSKPPILQALEGKWWRWAKPLAEVGIDVLFIDREYAIKYCREKNGCGNKKCNEC